MRCYEAAAGSARSRMLLVRDVGKGGGVLITKGVVLAGYGVQRSLYFGRCGCSSRGDAYRNVDMCEGGRRACPVADLVLCDFTTQAVAGMSCSGDSNGAALPRMVLLWMSRATRVGGCEVPLSRGLAFMGLG